MHIGIIGAGALGSLLAVRLHQSGQHVIVFHKNPDTVKRIRETGIILRNISGKTGHETIEAQESLSAHVADLELIIVAVKAYDTRRVGRDLKASKPRMTTVLTLQNGLGNIETLQHFLGQHRILGGSTTEASLFVRPGYVIHTGKGITQLGELNGKISNRAAVIQQVFSNAGFKTKLSTNIHGAIWSKAIINCAINPITALTGLRNGELLQRKELLELAKLIIDEGTGVAERCRVHLGSPGPSVLFPRVLRATTLNKSSMLQDLERGKKTEIEELNGTISKIAHKFGLPSCYNSLLATVISQIKLLGDYYDGRPVAK